MTRAGCVLLMLLALVAGCSSVEVHQDFDADADFAGYQSYAWIEQHMSATGAPNTLDARNDLLDKRIRSAVESQMAAKGFDVDNTAPDVLIVYHTGIENKVQVTDWGYTYSGNYWGTVGRDLDAYQYRQGTLLIDMVDAQTKQLAWRGTAIAVIQGSRTPEELEERINNVVKEIFKKYPPKK